MTLNHYYRSIIHKLVLCLTITLISGDTFVPLELDLVETLLINDKSRDYFLLYKKQLHFEVEGPIRLEVISRRAIPKTSTRKYEFGYQIQLDKTKPIEINHSKRKYDAVTSISHPGHGYTHSGNSIITLPEGKHLIQFDPIKTGKPILIRIMKKLYPKLEGIVQSIIPNDSVKTVELSIGEKKRQYLILEPNEKITINQSIPGVLAVYGKYGFDSQSDELESYQIQTFENGKPKEILIDFTTKETMNIAKSRICQWEIGDEQKEISFQLINGSNPVFLRLLHYNNYE